MSLRRSNATFCDMTSLHRPWKYASMPLPAVNPNSPATDQPKSAVCCSRMP